MTTTDRFVEGLKSLGWEITEWYSLTRNYGQPMMNKAAGEAAPCWEIDAVLKDGKKIIIQGHQPALWILKHDPKTWCVDDENYSSGPRGLRLHIDAPELPPHW
jgi:hypothetical protein